MVLESLFNPFAIKKKPWEMFFAGFLFASISLVISYYVFKEAAALLTVFLVVLCTVPILYTTIKNEEELDLKSTQEWSLLKEHTKVLIFLMFLFLGITTAFVLAYVVLPQDVVKVAFSLQDQAINHVNQNVQITGNITRFGLFGNIFFNNLKVLFFCIIFSLLYGTGAMFILTWNASVIATAMGSVIKTQAAQALASNGSGILAAYLGAASFSVARYMTHGLLEIAAYFVAGLAGGIISIALIKHNLSDDKVLVDALDLIMISVGILFVAGVVEVYVTPALFL
ncbi:stage II sporulation protein M [Candidatus Woesearchaeota archaeon]|nr:stage II sporulation protein M [Candidatus Woesearchaeota archaeon]